MLIYRSIFWLISSQRFLDVMHFTAWIDPLFWFQLYRAMNNYDWFLWAFTNSHNEEFNIAIESIQNKAFSKLFKTLLLKSQKCLREVNVLMYTLTFPSCCFIGIYSITERDKNINKKKTNICSCLHPHGSALIVTHMEKTELVVKSANICKVFKVEKGKYLVTRTQDPYTRWSSVISPVKVSWLTRMCLAVFLSFVLRMWIV